MYIVIEGIDGSGKDTQADLLAAKLNQPLQVNEPDNELPTGKLLRQLLKSGEYPQAHSALFLADRLALMESKIQPALANGRDVISVRSWLSTLVYQQDQWPLDWLKDIHRLLPCKPTHLVLLDVDPAVGMGRTQRRGGPLEVYERLDIQIRNRSRYLDLLPDVRDFMAPDAKVIVMDASQSPDEVNRQIMRAL